MAPTDTVLESKAAFLRSQVRLLSSPFALPRNWQNRAPASEKGDLKERVVAEVLYKLNALHRRHTKSAYSSQPLRHIAEQIDKLYWEAAAPDASHTSSPLEVLNQGTDYVNELSISALPEEWPIEGANSDEDLERYISLASRLRHLSDLRSTQRRKLAQYKHLQQLLQPFENPNETIQPNLVTRDGDLGGELDRMRMLMARVRSRIGGLEGLENGSREGEPATESEVAKLEKILNG